MRVLVIGCGSIGRRHIGNLLALGCEVSAHDLDDEALFYLPRGVYRYGGDSYFALAQDFDALVVSTPLEWHLLWAESAVQTGRALFVEKPLGALEDIPRWRAVAAECEQRNLVTQVGYMHRFHAAARALTSIHSPVIGRFSCDADMRTWPGQSYGPALLELSHEIDLALHAGAPSERVSVDVADEFRSVFSLCGNGQRWRVSLNGQASKYDRRWYVANDVMHVEVALGDTNASNPDALYKAEMEHFLNAVRTGKQSAPAATLADGLRVLEVAAKVHGDIHEQPRATV